ncbi:Cna B-type domain-containing protein [Clostridium sp. HCS.1]|uniref:Cna B-type domain-containing protein n=1 Tax=Clostridium sp. HCS.1 TaxID=3238594 RepID=UPI003A0FB927
MKRKSNYKKLLSFLLVFALMLPTSMTTLAAPDEGMAEITANTKDESSNVDTTKENEETIVTNDSSGNKNELISDETKYNENNTTNTTLKTPDESAVENTAVIKDEGINVDEAKENEETIITDDSSENEVTLDEEKDDKNNTTDEAENKTKLKASSKVKAKSVEEDLKNGINVITQSVSGKTFNIDDGKCVNINGPSSEKSIEFTNCVFNLSAKNYFMRIEGVDLATKVYVSGNVIFNNCIFNIDSVKEAGAGGNDAAIYLTGDRNNITFNNSSITSKDAKCQVVGLYGSANVTFNDSNISTIGTTALWSYAMYGESVLNLNKSTMSATGMNRIPGHNVNAIYSGDKRTNYDAIYINNSTIDFSDNDGGGFAINKINIHVYNNSKINVNNNAGNASNSGVWYVNDSEITMNGNKGHGFSHIGDEMTNTKLTLKHNGYAGYYLQSTDAYYTNCEVDIRCNGERLLSYSAGDVWLNGHTATFNNCPYVWLGAVGRKGQVVAENCPYFVAYDLFENKTKENTAPVLEGVTLSEQDKHILFLNPSKDFDYARGDTEGKTGNSNDDDLFNDIAKETVIGKGTAKIGTLTTAQLSHHKYDWTNGTVTDKATPDTFGVKAYECVDSCAEHKEWTGSHTSSFDCTGTYVYAPLVGLTFDSNAGDDEVNNMPEAQATINYEDTAIEPNQVPERVSKDNVNYAFTGWYTDKECTKKFDFSTKLTNNWTTLYAGWKELTSVSVTKVWDDENNQDGKRPDSVTITLLANGEETNNTITLNADNNWEGIFAGLDKYADGKEILYTVKEIELEGYTSKVTGDAENGFVITNTHTPEKLGKVSVTKVWDDENDKDGKRPETVTITLLANGKETNHTITLNADNKWQGTFTGLDKYADGKEILYTVKEVKVEGYSSKITGDVEKGFVITNTHTPEKVVINSGTKGISTINTVKTGDTSSFVYLILLLIGSVTGIGVLGIRRRK